VVLRNSVQRGDTAVTGETTREPDLFVSAIRFESRPERALIEALPSRYPIDEQRPRTNAFAAVKRSRRMVASLATANPSRREANRMGRMKDKVVVVLRLPAFTARFRARRGGLDMFAAHDQFFEPTRPRHRG
jgi:hypothetical protein